MSKSNRKNLVVIHLESLSNEIYRQEMHNLTGLTKLMDESIRLNYFFSSATSSLMAFTDFLHGNDAEIENSTTFDDLQKPSNYNDNLFDALKKKKL
ncbi:hypothetical protein HMSSN036_23650 [Paenibacillus macerans]|nr:hypothetical protein HMSSN036_23650 [Paenibacillus macerans]